MADRGVLARWSSRNFLARGRPRGFSAVEFGLRLRAVSASACSLACVCSLPRVWAKSGAGVSGFPARLARRARPAPARRRAAAGRASSTHRHRPRTTAAPHRGRRPQAPAGGEESLNCPEKRGFLERSGETAAARSEARRRGAATGARSAPPTSSTPRPRYRDPIVTPGKKRKTQHAPFNMRRYVQ